MIKLQMVDLLGQYNKIKTEVDAGIQEVINAGQFINGPQVKQFEQELAAFLGVKHVIACANGTDALQLAFMALNLQAGDEVIMPSFNYIASAEVVALLGLKPIFVDVDPATFCLDPKQVELAITSKTKVIVAVHLFGQCSPMEALMLLANQHQITVIEDTAQSIGAAYRFNDGSRASAGTIGQIGTTSFFPSKNLGCFGDGGAIMTNDDALATQMRMLCNHGQRTKYYHEIVGVNSRLDTIQAAVLLAKLPHLKEYETARNQAAVWYDELLAGCEQLEIPARNASSTHVFHQYTVKLKDEGAASLSTRQLRDRVRQKLSEEEIPTMVYYPEPLHLQQACRVENQKIELPISEQLSASVLSLPMHTEMTRAMVETICASLRLALHELEAEA